MKKIEESGIYVARGCVLLLFLLFSADRFGPAPSDEAIIADFLAHINKALNCPDFPHFPHRACGKFRSFAPVFPLFQPSFQHAARI